MTTGFRNAGGVDLDSIFAPYSSGTKAGLTGFRTGVGQDMRDRFQPYTSGQKAGLTGFRNSSGTDLRDLFQWVNAGSGALPIDGNAYTGSINIVSGQTGYARVGFRIVSGNTWQVYSQPNGGTVSVLDSGTIPAGASTVKFTWGTYTVPGGYLDAGGAVTNPAASAVAVSGNPNTFYTTDVQAATSGSRERSYPFTVDFYNGTGSNISHSQCTLIGDTEGSI